MLNLTANPPLALYVHIPWCVRKCPYCDFNSHEARGALPEDDYVAALLRDLEQDLPRVWGRRIVSVFFGGGTPSLLSPDALDRLISGLRALLAIGAGVEITLEANPGTVDAARFRDFRAAGVNRLSIGVQSFRDAQLRALGRIHGGEEARRACDVAREAGFDNVNLDLMFGLPGDGLEGSLHDLRTAVALAPEHLSWYQLTLEPNTAFHRSPPVLPEDEAIWAMQEAGQALLAESGYGQYEVSAYARPDRRCAHNLNYWLYGDYLGIGAGAHAKITDVAGGRILRITKPRHPRTFLASAGTPEGIATDQAVARADLPFEFMMNALRLNEGFPAALFLERTGLPLSVVEAPMKAAEARGWLDWGLTRIRATADGLRYLNDLLCLFVPETGHATRVR